MRLSYNVIYDKARRYVCRRDYIKEMNGTIKKKGYADLSSSQKKELKSYYESFGFPVDYSFHRFHTAARGTFCVEYIPDWLYRNFIEPSLIRTNYSYAWEDKCMMPKLIGIPVFPRTILRNCGGYFYDENFSLISKERALKLIANEPDFVLKYGSSCNGEGIIFIKDPLDFSKNIDSYGANYLLQARVEQHPFLKEFNDSSVNIMRMITLRVDGGYDVLLSTFRIGAKGSFTDNGGIGNTLFVNVGENGVLSEYGFFGDGTKVYESSSGKKLKDSIIPSFEEAKKTVIEAHSYLPYFDIVGWDITIDSKGKPVMMEYNLKSQGIKGPQLSCGPLFGKYTDEILKRASKFV